MHKIVSIGDVFIDYISDVSALESAEVYHIKSSTNHFNPVQIMVGGSGLQFADAAKKAGFSHSSLIGKIGSNRQNDFVQPDLPGIEAIRYMDSQHIVHNLAVDATNETGRIMIIYLPGDKRLMISDPLANSTLSIEDISPEMYDTVRQAGIIHVSGYTLLQENRRLAVQHFLKYNRQNNQAISILDVVPHNIYKFLSLSQIHDLFNGMLDCMIVEAPCAHQLLGYGKLENPSPPIELIKEMIQALKTFFPMAIIFINPSHALVSIDDSIQSFHISYNAGGDSRGQSAVAQAKLIYQLFN